MADRLVPRIHGPRPASRPQGLVDWNGYVFPSATGPFRRDELIAIATANGRAISPDLLHKWRYWRLIPGPTPGGPTDKGRGKGQMWPIGAAWRVAWISRWLADSLTYDILRLAIWPWTRELDHDRVDMVRDSMAGFLVTDRAYHDVVWEALPSADADAMDPYFLLVGGDPRGVNVDGSLDIAGIATNDPRRGTQAEFFRLLSFDELEATVRDVHPDELRTFIEVFRGNLADREQLMTQIFWSSPLGLARILLRELHRYQLTKRGEL